MTSFFPIPITWARANWTCLPARHDVYTAARTAKLGLKFGLGYGLVQDALESLKGNHPAYMDFLLGKRGPQATDGNPV